MLDARVRARESRLRLHCEVAAEEHLVAFDPDCDVAPGVVRPERKELGRYAAEVQVVLLVEHEVGLAELRILEKLGVD